MAFSEYLNFNLDFTQQVGLELKVTPYISKVDGHFHWRKAHETRPARKVKVNGEVPTCSVHAFSNLLPMLQILCGATTNAVGIA